MSRISSRDFIERHASYWNPLLPFAERYLRQINRQLLEQRLEALESETAPNRRAFVNELAFEVCVRFYPRPIHDIDAIPLIRQIEKPIFERIARLEGLSPGVTELTLTELREVMPLARRLSTALRAQFGDGSVEFHPRLAGVGVLGEIFPDFIAQQRVLGEVKAGERTFRIIDLRQVILYGAVSSMNRTRALEEFYLVNPRQGIAFRSSFDELCLSISGRTAIEVFGDLSFLLTQEGITQGQIY